METVKAQKKLIFLFFLMYASVLMGRMSYDANIPSIIDYYGVTRAEAGLVGTFYLFASGICQIFHAVFCKYYPKRYVLTGMLLISAVFNILMFFRPPFWCIKYLWLLNGISLSAFWSSMILQFGESLDQSLMKWAVMSIGFSPLLANLLSYGGSALFSYADIFHFSFLFSAILLITIALIWFIFYNTLTPKRNDLWKEKSKAQDSPERKTIHFALIVLLMICAILVISGCFVRDGIQIWMPSILTEQFGFDSSISRVLTLILPLFGVFGSWLALWVNRRIKGFGAMVGLFFLCMSACLGGVLFSIRNNDMAILLLLSAFTVCLGYAISQALVAIMPLAMRDRINSGFLTGLMNSCSFVGVAAGNYGIGWIADKAGWEYTIRVLFFVTSLSVLVAGVAMLFTFLQKKQELHNQTVERIEP